MVKEKERYRGLIYTMPVLKDIEGDDLFIYLGELGQSRYGLFYVFKRGLAKMNKGIVRLRWDYIEKTKQPHSYPPNLKKKLIKSIWLEVPQFR